MPLLVCLLILWAQLIGGGGLGRSLRPRLLSPQLQMLGYDISWAAFNIIEVMSASKFTFKVRRQPLWVLNPVGGVLGEGRRVSCDEAGLGGNTVATSGDPFPSCVCPARSWHHLHHVFFSVLSSVSEIKVCRGSYVFCGTN